MSRILHFVTLLAMLLMPLAMAPAAQARVAAAPVAHCQDQAPSPDSKHQSTECAMACAAALPATIAPPLEFAAISHAATAVSPPPVLHGIPTEIATPPPRGF